MIPGPALLLCTTPYKGRWRASAGLMRTLTNLVLMLVCAFAPGIAAAQEPVQPVEPPITLRQFAANTLHDQKPIFTLPWRAAHGKHWKPALGVTLGTAALVTRERDMTLPIAQITDA